MTEPMTEPLALQREHAQTSKAWPFEEARKLLKHLGGKLPAKGYVLFETGYGPSGLPHIGTFGEVARTTMVRRAFEILTGWPTRLICFSDDLDGMRKVPSNVENIWIVDAEKLTEHLQKPLSKVPFGDSTFGEHNNAKLREFLDKFGFDYEFMSATDFYESGAFDKVLLRALDKYDEIMEVMLASLREERRATYSCFLPILNGRVLYEPVTVNKDDGTINFIDEDGKNRTLPVTGGNVKLQWKPDFGARWAALGVHFEMYGKDHSTNTVIYDKICRILGGRAPAHYVYEMFLDEEGGKISKSDGNGISIDKWLRYASAESLSYFMYQKPQTAKRLHLDVIPKSMDDYDADLRAYVHQDEVARMNNPVFHIHGGGVPEPEEFVMSFAMLLNLATVSTADNKGMLWQFIRKYAPHASPETHPELDKSVFRALCYFTDVVFPNLEYRDPDDKERAAMEELSLALRDAEKAKEIIVRKNKMMGKEGVVLDNWSPKNEDDLQALVFAIGKLHGFDNLRDWFQALYEVLLGASQGPRFGGFIAAYEVEQTAELIDKALDGFFTEYP